jgi:amino acid transporter
LQCEEVVDPAINVPKAMMITQLFGTVAGAVFIIAILFALPDESEVIYASLGSAGYVIFQSAMGTPGGALALLLLSVSCSIWISTECLCAASRFVWAFARDGGLPGSRWLAKVNPTLQVPLNATLVVVALNALLGLISLGSSVAYGAFLGCA